MIHSIHTFKRTHLAIAYCDSLEGRGINNATSGLFLAGPRRVGKSTFLKEDLIPEAQRREWLTLYVDLWANKLSNPALLITEALKASLVEQQGKIKKLTDHIKLQKINLLQTIELDFSKPGLPENLTLVDLTKALFQACEKPILLVIDEAQHALTTAEGINTMFALKSARDQMNFSNQAPCFMLVLTGSHRDKLAQLVIKKDQPFFGSEITTFPLLGADYTDCFTKQANCALASHNQFTKESMWRAFQLMGYRPEILRQLAGRVALDQEASSFSDLLLQDASLWHSQIWEEFENDFLHLSDLQRAILSILIEKGRSWSPFSEESMQYYTHIMGQPLSVSTVQAAIQGLREQNFIWQTNRGIYSLEDESFAEWFKHTQKKRTLD